MSEPKFRGVWCDIGRRDYAEAVAIQDAIQKRQLAGEQGPTLLYVEHPPTITIGRRGGSDEVVAPKAILERRGVAVHETDRGGQVTLHAPGQLVAYPLFHVEHLGLHRYLYLLEEVAIRVIAKWGVKGYRVEGRTGAWVGKEKICAMGVHCRRWWTRHGLALNVTTDLNLFGLIIPCGIRDRGVCSLHKLLGDATPSWLEVRDEMTTQFRECFECELEVVDSGELVG